MIYSHQNLQLPISKAECSSLQSVMPFLPSQGLRTLRQYRHAAAGRISPMGKNEAAGAPDAVDGRSREIVLLESDTEDYIN
jgi:hypothetical protein